MTIYELQNEEGMLNLLKLQRIVYSKAKLVQTIFIIISLIITITFIILTNSISNEILWNFSMLTAFIVFIAGIIVNFYVDKLKNLAAGIQQKFDIYVLGVPFSYLGLAVPDREQINNLTTKYKKRKIDNLNNWYSDYSAFEDERQVLFCQKENVNWDKTLRTYFLIMIIGIIAVMAIVIITIGIISNNIHLMFSIFSWILPWFSWGISTIKNLYNDIKGLSVLDGELKDIETIEIAKANDKINEVQRLIWEHRKKCYLIPDFFYKFNRKAQQERNDEVARILSEGQTNEPNNKKKN